MNGNIIDRSTIRAHVKTTVLLEHQIDLIPGAPLPNKAPYHVNPEETKEIQRQVQQLIDNGHVRESLSPCAVPVILAVESPWFLRD